MISLRKISVSITFIFISLTAPGTDPVRISAGAGEAGMGYVCIMKSGFWSSFHNQASLPLNGKLSAGVNYENRFGIGELGTRSAALTLPAGNATFGVIWSRFGYTDYKRDFSALACGMKLSEKISAGVQIDYFSEKTSGEYDNYQSVTVETGIILIPSENITVGVHLFNPVPNSVRESEMPAGLRLGAGTSLSKYLFTGAELEMSSGKDPVFRTGFEYEPVAGFQLRSGFCTEFNSFSFGVGYSFKKIQMDFAFATHEQLGLTSSVSMIFNLRNNTTGK